MRRSRKSPPLFDRVGHFVRDYTEGMNSRDLQRLFQRDAANVYAVLTREHARDPEPKSGFKRWLYRTRLAFLGLSYKLTPARRLLFAVAILFLLLGLTQDSETSMGGEKTEILIDFSPIWFMASVLSLVYLLALELVDRS